MKDELMIEHLSTLTPRAARTERIVARCHERMATHRRRLERQKSGVAYRNLAAGFALIYFAAVAIRALSVFSAL
jgi:hypothetical protein